MKDLQYTRKGRIIRDANKEIVFEGKSINDAKRESHKIQMESDGKLGLGTLRKAR